MAGSIPTLQWQLPDGWSDFAPPLDVVAAAALATPGGAFGVNVTAIALPGEGLSLPGIRAGIASQLADTLESGVLLDLNESSLDDREALRVLAAFAGEGGDELTVEQWIVIVRDTQLVVSGTCPSLDYHWHAPAIGAIAESIELDV